MEYKKYNSYEEKIAELEKIFGQWPPPFDPVWAVQVSQGRCGSNQLWDIVNSFFEGAIGSPRFEGIDDLEYINRSNSKDNWIPEQGKKYLYYNVHGIEEHRLHFPIFFWLLLNSPKIIHLIREDHLKRAISIYYANLATDMYPPGERFKHFDEICLEPIDIEQVNKYIRISIVEIELIKAFIGKFASEKRLLQISHFDLYYQNTFRTLSELIYFLECDPKTTFSAKTSRETRYDLIPNLEELLKRYGRDLTEQKYWVPESIDLEEIQNEIDRRLQKHIRLNLPTQSSNMSENTFSKPCINNTKVDRTSFDLKANQKFYINEIPKSAKYVSPVEFSRLPNIKRNIYMLDNRWTAFNAEISSHIQEFFEVIDIQKNHVSEKFEWICGFSVFFLKAKKGYAHAEHRCSPEAHTKLIEGVNQLTNYHDRCPKTLLRFYVSPEVWERLTEEDILYRPGTEFYKMQFDSEESQLGTIWRMLALFDKDFEWAIQADCGPNEDWILARIAHWSRDEFKAWLDHEFHWGGEMLLWEHNWHPAKNKSFIKEGEQVWGNIDIFDFLSAGGIVTRPTHMPPVEQVIHRHIAERPFTNNFYHAGADVWSSIRAHEDKIPYGWEGFGCDQEVWRFLKKMMPVRHLIHSQSTDHMRKVDIPEDHMTKRIISQLISEGSEFVDVKTQEPIFNLI